MFYLKYRPQKFSGLIGLPKIVNGLTNQLKKGNPAHAYLFYGPRGSGKTTTARILAKALNCQKLEVGSSKLEARKEVRGSKLDKKKKDQASNFKLQASSTEPCNKCGSCKAITDGRYIDLIEIDAASNRRIDDIRDLKEKVNLAPSTGKLKFYIIDEAHMLTKEAFNALLKTLEEPPKSVYFVLCTTEPNKVPATIRSRCQQFEFKRASISDLVDDLRNIAKAEKHKIDETKLKLIAKASMGGYRDAETMLEQVIVGGLSVSDVIGGVGEEPVSELIDHLLNNETKKALIHVNKVFETGADLTVFTSEILEYLRKLLLIKSGVGEELVDATKEQYKKMESQCGDLSTRFIQNMVEEFRHALDGLKDAPIPQLPLEVTIVGLMLESRNQRIEIGSGNNGGDGGPANAKSQNVGGGDSRSRPNEPGISEPENRVLEVEEKWKLILEKVKPHNHSVEALLRSTKPKFFDGENLIIEAYYAFHKERLDHSKNRDVLEAVLKQIFGGRVLVKCILGKKEGGFRNGLTDKNVEEVRGGEEDIAKKAVEVFSSEFELTG